jgi:hypothetical protein
VVVAAGATDTAMGSSLDDGPSLRSGSRTAGFGAIGPSIPTGDDAVHGTRMSVAVLGHLEGGASSTVALGAKGDTTGHGEGTGAALQGADTESSPRADRAIDVVGSRITDTCSRVADALIGKVRAKAAAVTGGCHDIAGALLLAGDTEVGTRHTASAPSAPFADNTAYRAAVGTAVLGCVEHGAGDASVGSRDDDRTSVGHRATAASLCAFGPRRPHREVAIYGARVGIARVALIEVGAGSPTVGSGLRDRTGTGLGATTANAGAHIKRRPIGDLAVDGAAVDVAAGCDLDSGARGTAVRSLGEYTACADLRAGAASDGAFAPGAPGRDLAIDGARLDVTSFGLSKSWACDATVGIGGEHVARAGVCATTADDGASAVRLPLRDGAVNGAFLHVASVVIVNARAESTTVLRSTEHRAGTVLEGSTTRCAAVAPGRPRGYFAVDRASVDVAWLSFGLMGAGTAAVFGGGSCCTGPLYSHTATAAHGASSPLTPLADDAVNGASLGVAWLRFGEGRALGAVGKSLNNDAAGVRL